MNRLRNLTLAWVWIAMLIGAAPAKKVLFIGIDGCRFDALQGANAPELKSLIASGAYADDTQILPGRAVKNDTVSGPGWSSLLTGVWSDKHGVLDNEFKGTRLDAYPHFFRHLKQQFPQARTVSLEDWNPIQRWIVRDADVNQSFAGPKMPVPDGGPTRDFAGEDQVVLLAAIAELSEHDPTALFVYQGQVDETGHRRGFHPSVPEYVAAIEQVDQNVRELLAAVRHRSTFDREEWLIVVSSDHGGIGKNHTGGHHEPQVRNSFVILVGPTVIPGKLEQTSLVDVPATILTYLGVTIRSEWELDGHAIGLQPAATP